MGEFKTRNDSCNAQLEILQRQMEAQKAEEAAQANALDMEQIRRFLEKELSFCETINSNLAASILEKAVVKADSTRQEIHLGLFLKLGQQYEAVYIREKTSLRITRLRNITPKPPTRRT